MHIKLIAADLDGTLLDSRKRLPDELPALLEQLTARGIHFAPASGRQYYNLVEVFGREDMTFIAENGAMVFENGTCLYCDDIGREDLETALAMIRKQPNTYPVLAGARSAWCEDDDPVFRANADLYYARLTQVDDLLTVDDRICKIAVFEKNHAETGCYPALMALADRMQVVLSGADWVDLMNPGVSKGKAIEKLCESLGITPDGCMAFGDYLNDEALLRAVTHSFAMANAHPDIKAISRYQAPSNDENGVVRAIRDFLAL